MSDVKEKDGIPSAADSPETAVDTEPVADTAEAPEAAAPPPEADAPEETPAEDAPAEEAPAEDAPAEDTPEGDASEAAPVAVPVPLPDGAEAPEAEASTADPAPDGGKPVKKKRKYRFGGTFWPGIFILVILLLISFVVLGFRLNDYANRDNREVLLKSNMDAELDIFSVTYKNSSGEIIIEGAEGEKVIAPGAWVDYSVYLRNKDTVAIDYTFIAQVEVINLTETPGLELPLVFRIMDNDLNYIAGDAKTWVGRAELDGLSHNGTLQRDESTEYTFQWKWPFEGGDDEYDTFLGNLSEDVSIKISFVLRSEANTSLGLGDDFWRTGPGRTILIIIFALLLLIAIILLIIAYFKNKRVETIEEPAPEPEVIPEPEAEPVVVDDSTGIRYSFAGKKHPINLDILMRHFEDGDSIDINTLKSKGLIPASVKQIKILARNSRNLDKAYHIQAQAASANAKLNVTAAGGTITIVRVDEVIRTSETVNEKEAVQAAESIRTEETVRVDEPVRVAEAPKVEEVTRVEEAPQVEEASRVDELEINRIEKIR